MKKNIFIFFILNKTENLSLNEIIEDKKKKKKKLS